MGMREDNRSANWLAGTRCHDLARQLHPINSGQCDRRGRGIGFVWHTLDGTVPVVAEGKDKKSKPEIDVAKEPNGLDKLAIQMLNDRLLVKIPEKDADRRSMGGILIPATAQISKRLVWAEVVAFGQNVRSVEVGDRVLFGPEDRYEVEVGGVDYIMLRERDIHAVAASRIDGHTGLYL